jgi:shikimate dehydrogenase
MMSQNFLSTLTGSFAQPAMENPTGVVMEAAFKHQQLNWRYINCEIAPASLKEAVAGAKAMQWRGFNCSIPHKINIIEHLDGLGQSAKIIGAVNTVINNNGKLIGENTDGRGFVESIKDTIDPADKHIVLFGAGGAARAVAVELALAGAKQLTIVNRSIEKAQDLCDLIEQHTSAAASPVAWENTYSIPSTTHLVINATSIGLYPDVDATLDIDTTSITSNMVVADGIFNPPQTQLIQSANSNGCKTVPGIGMLVQQGAIAFEYWTGIKPNIEVMEKALREALEIAE